MPIKYQNHLETDSFVPLGTMNINNGIRVIDGELQIYNNSAWNPVPGESELTKTYNNLFYVSKSFTGEANGSYNAPFPTITNALDAIGQPTTLEEYRRNITIDIIEPETYTENIIIPHGFITIKGSGVIIDGNITREISSETQYGSSENGCFTLQGSIDSRDYNNRGIVINGFYRCQLDTTTSTATSHDTYFINCYFDNEIRVDYGLLSVGTNNLYATGCTFNGNFDGENIVFKRIQQCIFNETTSTIGTIIQLKECEFNNVDLTIINAIVDTPPYNMLQCFFDGGAFTIPESTIKVDKLTSNTLSSLVGVAVTLTELDT